MGLGGSIGNIAKKLSTYQPAYQVGKRVVSEAKKRFGKGRAGSTSRTSADVTLRRKKAGMAKMARSFYAKKMAKMKTRKSSSYSTADATLRKNNANKQKKKKMMIARNTRRKHNKEQDAYRK